MTDPQLPIGTGEQIQTLLSDRTRTVRDRATQAATFITYAVCMDLNEPAPTAEQFAAAYADLDRPALV